MFATGGWFVRVNVGQRAWASSSACTASAREASKVAAAAAAVAASADAQTTPDTSGSATIYRQRRPAWGRGHLRNENYTAGISAGWGVVQDQLDGQGAVTRRTAAGIGQPRMSSAEDNKRLPRSPQSTFRRERKGARKEESKHPCANLHSSHPLSLSLSAAAYLLTLVPSIVGCLFFFLASA